MTRQKGMEGAIVPARLRHLSGDHRLQMLGAKENIKNARQTSQSPRTSASDPMRKSHGVLGAICRGSLSFFALLVPLQSLLQRHSRLRPSPTSLPTVRIAIMLYTSSKPSASTLFTTTSILLLLGAGPLAVAGRNGATAVAGSKCDLNGGKPGDWYASLYAHRHHASSADHALTILLIPTGHAQRRTLAKTSRCTGAERTTYGSVRASPAITPRTVRYCDKSRTRTQLSRSGHCLSPDYCVRTVNPQSTKILEYGGILRVRCASQFPPGQGA